MAFVAIGAERPHGVMRTANDEDVADLQIPVDETLRPELASHLDQVVRPNEDDPHRHVVRGKPVGVEPRPQVPPGKVLQNDHCPLAGAECRHCRDEARHELEVAMRCIEVDLPLEAVSAGTVFPVAQHQRALDRHPTIDLMLARSERRPPPPVQLAERAVIEG